MSFIFTDKSNARIESRHIYIQDHTNRKNVARIFYFTLSRYLSFLIVKIQELMKTLNFFKFWIFFWPFARNTTVSWSLNTCAVCLPWIPHIRLYYNILPVFWPCALDTIVPTIVGSFAINSIYFCPIPANTPIFSVCIAYFDHSHCVVDLWMQCFN